MKKPSFETKAKENRKNDLHILGLVGLDSNLPNRPPGQQTPILPWSAVSISGVPVPNEPELHHLWIKPYELEQIEVGSIRMQVIQYLSMRRKAGVISLGPGIIRKLIITTKALKLGRIIRTVLPNSSNGVGSLKNNWVVRGKLFGSSYTADTTSNNPNSRGNDMVLLASHWESKSKIWYQPASSERERERERD